MTRMNLTYAGLLASLLCVLIVLLTGVPTLVELKETAVMLLGAAAFFAFACVMMGFCIWPGGLDWVTTEEVKQAWHQQLILTCVAIVCIGLIQVIQHSEIITAWLSRVK